MASAAGNPATCHPVAADSPSRRRAQGALPPKRSAAPGTGSGGLAAPAYRPRPQVPASVPVRRPGAGTTRSEEPLAHSRAPPRPRTPAARRYRMLLPSLLRDRAGGSPGVAGPRRASASAHVGLAGSSRRQLYGFSRSGRSAANDAARSLLCQPRKLSPGSHPYRSTGPRPRASSSRRSCSGVPASSGKVP